MSQDKAKPNGGKKTDAKAKASPVPAAKAAAVAPEPPPGPVAPLFNRVDWLTFAITTLLVFAGYSVRSTGRKRGHT